MATGQNPVPPVNTPIPMAGFCQSPGKLQVNHDSRASSGQDFFHPQYHEMLMDELRFAPGGFSEFSRLLSPSQPTGAGGSGTDQLAPKLQELPKPRETSDGLASILGSSFSDAPLEASLFFGEMEIQPRNTKQINLPGIFDDFPSVFFFFLNRILSLQVLN